jgi:hypothetical protein
VDSGRINTIRKKPRNKTLRKALPINGRVVRVEESESVPGERIKTQDQTKLFLTARHGFL